MDSNPFRKIYPTNEERRISGNNNQNAEGSPKIGGFYSDRSYLRDDDPNIRYALKSLYLVIDENLTITIKTFEDTYITNSSICHTAKNPGKILRSERVAVFGATGEFSRTHRLRNPDFDYICQSEISVDHLRTLWSMYRSSDPEAKELSRDSLFLIFKKVADEFINKKQ